VPRIVLVEASRNCTLPPSPATDAVTAPVSTADAPVLDSPRLVVVAARLMVRAADEVAESSWHRR
jgi:hypothetical protein